MRVRIEPFGAWVRLDDPSALVAIDRETARSLGIDGGEKWTKDVSDASAPLEVHLAVTSRCPATCTGCYLDASPDGASPSFETLRERIDAIARAGVFTIAFGGGEPLVRKDLGELAAYAKSRGLVPVVTTSGIGMTPRRAEELRAFAQVNVSYDGVGDAYEAVRGFDGASTAEAAMKFLAAAGVPFGVNVVLTRATFDRVEQTVSRAASLGAREIQLLRFKPAGRGVAVAYFAAKLDDDQISRVGALVERLSRRGDVRVRVDCAMLPFLADHVTDARDLVRFGVFGCEAGRHLAAARVDGWLAPCSFAPSSTTPIASLRREWRNDPLAARFREHAATPPEPCASCSVRDACRGGCRIVAAHAGDPTGPDPECPRVRAWKRSREVARP